MRLLIVSLLLVAAAFAAWISWLPPQPAPALRPARTSYEAADADTHNWAVLTRPIVWKKAADSLRERLVQNGLQPITIERREKVSLHAFDDERSFARRDEASRAAQEWEKLKVDAQIMQTDDGYAVALGRFFMPEYASRMEKQLNALKRPYRYQRRNMEIDVYRFTFLPTGQREAERLWQQVQATGLADPVLMTEAQLKAMFGADIALP